MDVQGIVGPQHVSDGSPGDFRQGRDSELVTSDAHGRYYESTLRGGIWNLATAVAGVTVAAANVFSAAAGQPLVGIYNPVGSGKNCVVLRGRTHWLSGTPGVSGAVWGFVPANAGVTAQGGAGAINGGTLQVGGSIAKTFVNAALTGAPAGQLLRYLGGPFAGAIAATSVGMITDEETAGDIIVPPGAALGIFVGAAGTSPIVAASMSWEEVAV